MKVVHLTSVHPRFDTRIFLKQCRSIAANGYDVSLVVADGMGDERRDGVRIIDVGPPRGRLDRMVNASRRVLKKAASLNADLYQIHDPELLPAALMLKRGGHKVVFDAHEDVPSQILGKAYLHPLARRPVSGVVKSFEGYACRRLDGVVAATPFIRDRFRAMDMRCIDVNNYPMAEELQASAGWEAKKREVCYVGGITAIRGALEMVRACGLLSSDARLNLGGSFSEAGLEAAVKREPGWARVNALGFLDRDGVRNVLHRSVAGLVTLHPIVNYLDALPVKMFEYMSAGIPVIASDFPLWRKIVEGNDCGICVDPRDPAAIAAAIDRLVEDPQEARRMGENGRRAVEQRYNWANEEKKLLSFYEEVLGGRGSGASPAVGTRA